MNSCFVGFSIAVVLLQVPCSLFAQTSVSGIISSSTTWTKSGSPYNLTANVQVKENVTLSIEAGVTVNGNALQIEVFGGLIALGSSNSKITFNNVQVLGSTVYPYFSTFDIENVNLRGGGILPFGVTNVISLTLRDCRFDGCLGISLYGTIGSSNSNIERNIFVGSGGIKTWINGSGIAYIRNNVFYQQSGGFAIQNDVSSFSGTSTIAEYNSFLSTDRVAINIPSGSNSAAVTAMNNYWNTADINVINSMITDRNDDLHIPSVVPCLPFLTVPHISTPAFPIISASQNSLNFGNVAAGLSSNLDLKIRNTSSGILSISNISSSNPRFTVSSASVNINAGDSVTVQVSFSPSTFGVQTGTLTLTHNAENTLPTIYVSGTGLAPSISLNPSSLDFGKVKVGRPAAKVIQISNVGNSALAIDSIALRSNFFTTQTNSLSISAGASTIMNVTYLPAGINKDSTTLYVYHKATGSPSSVVLRGEGVSSSLSLNTKSIVYSKVGLRASIDTVLVFNNTGGDSLRVASIVSDNPVFSARHVIFVVRPSQSFSDTIRFSPISVGTYSGKLLIVSDSPTSPDTVQLTGTRELLSLVGSSPNRAISYTLGQNYPNPFNPATTVTFSLPSKSFVSLKVFDALGRVTATLVEEELLAGIYAREWIAENVSSGIYFYRLQAGSFVDTKKLILLK